MHHSKFGCNREASRGKWRSSFNLRTSPPARVREGDDSFGFNAATEKFEDLIAAGVIDPAKVTRYALQNAASIASLMLTTEAMIAEYPEEKGEGGGMPGGMGGMGGMGMGM